MTEITKRFRSIEQLLKQSGFIRRSTNFSQQFGDLLQVVNIQSSKGKSSGSGLMDGKGILGEGHRRQS